MTDIPRGKYIGKHVGDDPLDPAEKQKLKAQMDRAYEDAKLGKEQKALDAGVLREALERAGVVTAKKVR